MQITRRDMPEPSRPAPPADPDATPRDAAASGQAEPGSAATGGRGADARGADAPGAAGPDLLFPCPGATARLAARAAVLARPGDAILLDGPLGAGKSAFARAFLRAASGDPALEVPSPTFTLVQEYALPPDGAGRAHHFDLYRLDGPADLDELGWDEARNGIVLVEWPERLGALAPADALRVSLRFPPGGEDGRAARLRGWPGRLAGLVAGLPTVAASPA